MFYFCVLQSPVTMEVNTLASKRAELMGNAASCSKAQCKSTQRDLLVLASSSCRELLGKARNTRVTCGRLKFH